MTALIMQEPKVESTNNRAGMTLRFSVLWRKMMQATFTEKGDWWVARILVDAVTCHFNDQKPDLSWI